MKAHIADIEAALGSKAFRPRRYGDGSISVTFNLNKLGDDVAGVADWVSRIEHKTVKPEQMSVAIEQMEAAICVHLLGKGIQATVSIDPENGATVVRLPRWSADTPSHAGDVFKIYATEKEARRIAEKRKLHRREESLIHQKHVSLLSLKSQVDQKLLKNLNVVLKTDVFGSLQAIKDSLEKLSNQEVAIRILHSGVGNVTESDVLLAKASDAVIFGFHVEADNKVKEEAKSSGVEIRTYQIIYDLIEDVKAGMSGLLEPEIVETVTGRAEIQQIFDLSSGKVAGSLVKEGKLLRNQPIKIVRGKDVVGTGKISGLKRFKEDVKEVEKGLECGILIRVESEG